MDETQNNLNLDMALQKIGGFGIFQLLATINIAIWRNAGMYCYNLYPYLVLPQKYECRESAAGEWQKCEALT